MSLPENHFGCDVVWRSENLCSWVYHRVCRRRMRHIRGILEVGGGGCAGEQINLTRLGETKIGQFDMTTSRDEQVIWFKISVNNANCVYILDCECCFSKIPTSCHEVGVSRKFGTKAGKRSA
jgi:hypothetical protein